MRVHSKTVRGTNLPANVAAKVRRLAKARRITFDQMLVELIEKGIEAEDGKQQEFRDLTARFQKATDPEEIRRLGDEIGRMIFGPDV